MENWLKGGEKILSLFSSKKEEQKRIEEAEKYRKQLENKQFLLDLLNGESDYQERRKSTIDTKVNYLIVLVTGLLTFLVSFVKFPKYQEVQGIEISKYYILIHTRYVGFFLLGVSLLLLLFVAIPDNYCSFDVVNLLEKIGKANVDKLKLMDKVIETGKDNLKANTKLNDRRFKLMRFSIITLITGAVLTVTTNSILINNIIKIGG